MKSINDEIFCPSEKDMHKIVWFAWGWDKFLMDFKERFSDISVSYPFYYDFTRSMIINEVPLVDDHEKHPQGLPQDPVVDHLSKILTQI